ncbi:MAG: NADH-quinone oxidoreductase subunit K, partial [Oscillospiraceae bacterium]|nr:NADH-quinone oxidoreductase subunit K [Oscillospiraceae bacterium]
PMIAEGSEAAAVTLYINPIPTGLVLTGIVVSVSVSAFSLALIQRIYRRYGTTDIQELLFLVKGED